MFNDFLEALADNHFEETPVDAKTFVESSDYLGQPGLSTIQYDIVEAMSQIYRKEDLQQLMGEEDGAKYYDKHGYIQKNQRLYPWGGVGEVEGEVHSSFSVHEPPVRIEHKVDHCRVLGFPAQALVNVLRLFLYILNRSHFIFIIKFNY